MILPTDEQLKKVTAAFWRGRKLVKEGTWTRKAAAPAADGWVQGGDDSRTTVLPQKLAEACTVYREAIAAYPTYDIVEELASVLEKLGKYEEASEAWREAVSVATQRGHHDKVPAMTAAASRIAKKVGKVEWAVKAVPAAPAAPAAPIRKSGTSPEDLALAFAEAVVAGDFDGAHAMLTSASRKKYSAAQLKKAYRKMTKHFESPATTAVVEEVVTKGAQLQPGDIAWIYVSVAGDEDPEAVTVSISDEGGKPLIRDIEWGRP